MLIGGVYQKKVELRSPINVRHSAEREKVYEVIIEGEGKKVNWLQKGEGE